LWTHKNSAILGYLPYRLFPTLVKSEGESRVSTLSF
jgi:hypothetical protein